MDARSSEGEQGHSPTSSTSTSSHIPPVPTNPTNFDTIMATRATERLDRKTALGHEISSIEDNTVGLVDECRNDIRDNVCLLLYSDNSPTRGGGFANWWKENRGWGRKCRL
jgi:hypothetical protein